jgi:hypothetical protein
VFRLWAGLCSQLHIISQFLVILGLLSRLHGLRFGSSLQDISSGRPHGPNSIPQCATLLSPLINITGYCLFTNFTLLPAPQTVSPMVMPGSALPLHFVHMALRHMPERLHLRSVSDLQRWTEPNLAFAQKNLHVTAHPLLPLAHPDL